jgi:hypothetical protein
MMMDTYGSPSVAVQGTSLNGARPSSLEHAWSRCLVQLKRLAPDLRSHPILDENVLISYAVHRGS